MARSEKIFSAVMKTILVVVFIVAAVIVVFSAAGYRLELASHKVVQTSMIVVKSLPRGTQVKLDGVLQDGTTSWRLGNLQAGRHSVTVFKSGYVNWEQDLALDPGQTALYEDVVLFLSEPAVEPLEGDQNSGLVSRLVNSTPDDNLVVKNESELYFAGSLVTRLSSTIYNPRLYPDDYHIAYVNDGALWIIDLNGTNSTKLIDMPNDAQYVFLDNGIRVLFQDGDQLKVATIR